MTVAYPALRGKFGTTEYYVMVMRVSDLVRRIRFPADIPEWKSRSLDEQFQRALNIHRIERQIKPYFVTDERRFSGSLVVAAHDPDCIQFEGISRIARGAIPNAYTENIEDLGFVVLTDQKLIPLDGQHRAKAFELAVNEPSVKGGLGLGDEKVSVIAIKFDELDSRYIFNKINKYAKSTSKVDNVITDDDDAMAIATRWLISQGVIPLRLVHTTSNSLSLNAHEFIPLATFYDANKSLLQASPIPSIGKPENMDAKEREKRQKELKKEWNLLITGIAQWSRALESPDKSGDNYRKELRKASILGKPIGQLSLIKGYAYACMQGIDRHLLIERLNRIDWSTDNGMWKGILIKPDGRTMYGSRVSNHAAKLVAHMLGITLSKKATDDLLDYIHGTKRPANKRLPRPV